MILLKVFIIFAAKYKRQLAFTRWPSGELHPNLSVVHQCLSLCEIRQKGKLLLVLIGNRAFLLCCSSWPAPIIVFKSLKAKRSHFGERVKGQVQHLGLQLDYWIIAYAVMLVRLGHQTSGIEPRGAFDCPAQCVRSPAWELWGKKASRQVLMFLCGTVPTQAQCYRCYSGNWWHSKLLRFAPQTCRLKHYDSPIADSHWDSIVCFPWINCSFCTIATEEKNIWVLPFCDWSLCPWLSICSPSDTCVVGSWKLKT